MHVRFWGLAAIVIVIVSWLVYRYLAPQSWKEWTSAGVQGLADLRGLGPMQRANAIIENCAHPAYRDYSNGFCTSSVLPAPYTNFISPVSTGSVWDNGSISYFELFKHLLYYAG